MGRVVRALLLVFAVAVLSAAPGRAAGELAAEASWSVVTSDTTQPGLPVARGDGGRPSIVDAAGLRDPADQRTWQAIAAMLPVRVDVVRAATCEPGDATVRVHVGMVTATACSRGPPSGSSPTSA